MLLIFDNVSVKKQLMMKGSVEKHKIIVILYISNTNFCSLDRQIARENCNLFILFQPRSQ